MRASDVADDAMASRAPSWVFHGLCSPVYAVGAHVVLARALEAMCARRNSRFAALVTLESPAKRARAAAHMLKAVAYLIAWCALMWYHVRSEDAKTFGGLGRLFADPTTVTATGRFRDLGPPTVIAPLCLYSCYVVDLARSSVSVVTVLHHLASVALMSASMTGATFFASDVDAKLYDEMVLGAMTILSMNCVPYAIFTYYHLGHSIRMKRRLVGYLHYFHHALTVYPFHALQMIYFFRKGLLFHSTSALFVICCAYAALLMDHVTTVVAIRKMLNSLTKKENLSRKFVGMWAALGNGDDEYESLVEKKPTRWQRAVRTTVKTSKILQ